MYEKYGQFIDGKWQKSSSGETYDVINPATEEVIGKASKANGEDIQKALKSAEKGLKIWRNTSPWERSKIIRKISAAPPTSPGPSVKGFPTSNVSHFDKISTLCLINSEIFLIIFALSQGEVFLQISKPFSADFRAL